MAELDVEIDALTNSVIFARTGASLQTRIVDWRDLSTIQRSLTRNWRFDWYAEARHRQRMIAALLVAHSDAIEGLVCFEPKNDHLHTHLLESAPYNVGIAKAYRGVPGNLIAYVCRESDRLGFDGFVAFDAKTELIDHYRQTLGAQVIGHSGRMMIDDLAAKHLIEQYFKEGDQWA